jgi:hypothetical protein
MTLEAAFAGPEADYKNKMLIHVFGHLHPEWERVYPIEIMFAHGYFHDIVIIDMKVAADDSPWLATHVIDLVGGHERQSRDWRQGSKGWYVRNMKIENGQIYSFVGTYRVRKNGSPVFKGRVIRRKLKEIK